MLREACWMSLIVAGVIAGGARVATSQNDPEQGSNSPVVTGEELFAEPAQMTAGTNVRLAGAVIRAKSGNVLRVAVGKHQIFVAPDDPSALEFLTIGAHINVVGTLRRTPSTGQAQKIYAMGASEARRLARTRFYVDAWSMSAVD